MASPQKPEDERPRTVGIETFESEVRPHSQMASYLARYISERLAELMPGEANMVEIKRVSDSDPLGIKTLELRSSKMNLRDPMAHWSLGITDFSDLDEDGIPMSYGFGVSKNGEVLWADRIRVYEILNESVANSWEVKEGGEIDQDSRTSVLINLLKEFSPRSNELPLNTRIGPIIRGKL